MSKFLTPMECRYISPWEFLHTGWMPNNGTDRWQLTDLFLYASDILKDIVELPVGFRWDKSSVPTVPVIYAAFGGRYTRSAGVHDYLCRQGTYARSKCDRVFLEAMRCENAEEIAAMVAAGIDQDLIDERAAGLEGQAQLMYVAVVLYSKTQRQFSNETFSDA